MRVAILSDIHANLHALEAVLRDMEREAVEEVVCLGDVVGYGAFPAECLRLVRGACKNFILGNHDYMASADHDLDDYYLEARKSLEWTRSRLTEAEREILGGFPLVLEGEVTTFVHASLHFPESWEYLDYASDILRHFRCQETAVCFAGHTHVPAVYSESAVEGFPISWNTPIPLPDKDRVLLNAGSVGQPRDADPRACYVIYDELQRIVTFRRVRYEVARAQNGIRAVRLPEFLAERLETGQ